MAVSLSSMCLEYAKRRLDGRLKMKAFNQGKFTGKKAERYLNWHLKRFIFKRVCAYTPHVRPAPQYPFAQLKKGESFLAPVKMNSTAGRRTMKRRLQSAMNSMIIDAEFEFSENFKGVVVKRVK